MFRPDWKEGTALYLPCDRVSPGGTRQLAHRNTDDARRGRPRPFGVTLLASKAVGAPFVCAVAASLRRSCSLKCCTSSAAATLQAGRHELDRPCVRSSCASAAHFSTSTPAYSRRKAVALDTADHQAQTRFGNNDSTTARSVTLLRPLVPSGDFLIHSSPSASTP